MVLDVHSPDYREDPYAFYRKLRLGPPLCRVEPMGYLAVARYDDVLTVLRDHKRFSYLDRAPQLQTIRGAEFMAGQVSLIACDPPEHQRLRALVNRAFTSAMVANLEPRIREIADSLTNGLLEKGDFDLILDFAIPFPVTIISEMLGIDPSRREDFKRWSEDIVGWRNIPMIRYPELKRAREDSLAKTGREMTAYLDEVIEERRREPRQDLVSALNHACFEEQRLNSSEVQNLIRLLLIAGNETTTKLIGNMALVLLADPELWPRLKQDPSLVPAFVEETLRFDGPVLSLTRRVTEDTELAGQPIKKGELVMALLGSANHDEKRFDRPEQFDMDRKSPSHLAFGSGIHFCLGAPLARLEAKVAIETLLNGFNGWEANGRPTRFDSFFLRGLSGLPLRLKASTESR